MAYAYFILYIVIGAVFDGNIQGNREETYKFFLIIVLLMFFRDI